MCAWLQQSCRATSTLPWGGGPHRLVPIEGLGPAPASPSWQSQCFSAGPVPTLPTWQPAQTCANHKHLTASPCWEYCVTFLL